MGVTCGRLGSEVVVTFLEPGDGSNTFQVFRFDLLVQAALIGILEILCALNKIAQDCCILWVLGFRS